MHSSKVLVIDAEPDIVRLVRGCLEREGLEVASATDTALALLLVERENPDLVVLDLAMDGLTLCQRMRQTRSMPILMLSTRHDDIDKILALEVGADDYLTKPFNPKVLVARVRALLRRGRMQPATPGWGAEDMISAGPIRIFPAARRVERGGVEVQLTPIEFSLLQTLVSNAGRTLTRQELRDRVWGPASTCDERTVDAHIRNLRQKLHAVDPTAKDITSVWRVGYKFER